MVTSSHPMSSTARTAPSTSAQKAPAKEPTGIRSARPPTMTSVCTEIARWRRNSLSGPSKSSTHPPEPLSGHGRASVYLPRAAGLERTRTGTARQGGLAEARGYEPGAHWVAPGELDSGKGRDADGWRDEGEHAEIEHVHVRRYRLHSDLDQGRRY